ncbi:transposase DDE domain protein [archaeon BMS3Abin17]|nr:transposase DDE domain protein [archaeon BMS3Abin17]
MEQQTKIFQNTENSKPIIALQKNKYTLEQEKERFINNMCDFIEPLNFEQLQVMGRPRADFKGIIKAILLMSYNSMSYRRTQSDLRKMHEEGLIQYIPPKSTLNDYVNNENTKGLIERLIQISALFFNENEDTTILDSTWFGQRMYSGGYRKVYDKKNAPLQKVRKLHIACLKNSKVIAYAKATVGTKNDSPLFNEIVNAIVKNGFHIKTVLADAGYSSKNNYALCKELGILNVFIDFKKNATLRRAKSDLWREKLRLYKEQKEIWNQTYRFRVIVEGIFSAIKKKNINYLRSRKEIAQDVEVLLKALVYNLTIIGKYS